LDEIATIELMIQLYIREIQILYKRKMKGLVYKITNSDESIVYIGSTTRTLKNRWGTHKNHYQRWIGGENRSCSIYPYFRDNGIENFDIHLISEYEIEERSQLLELEQRLIDSTACINQIKAFRSVEEKAEYQRQYHEQNIGTISAYQQQYRETNKDRVRDQIKSLASQRTDCACGLTYTRYHKARHETTKRHQRLMEQLQ